MARLRRLWMDWLALRWAAGMIGGLLAACGVSASMLAARYRSLRDMLLTDQPEYAGDLSWRDTLPSWASDLHVSPWWLLPPLIMVVMWLAVTIPVPRPDNPWDKDPRREFSTADRAWIRDCAGGRCEHRTLGLIRCRRPFEHADHHYPHAKGGATTRRNLVALCAKHNLKKSDRPPTLLATWLLYRARLHYFPARWRAWCMPDGRAEHKEDIR